jgi:glycosyltransferase involved in cell wall biosynthesis
MRIAYICGTESWGGLEMNQAKNALWMLQKSHSVLCLGLKDSKFQNYCVEHKIPFRAIKKHRKYYDFKAALSLRKLLQSNKIEHLILRDTRDMSVSVSAKFWGKTTFKVHYFMEMQLGVSKKNILHSIRFRLLDSWCCPLNWLKEQVEQKTYMPKNRIVVIPSGLDRGPFIHNIPQEQARRTLQLAQNKLIIGLAGRFDLQKGQLLLLHALNKLKNNEISILFLGEPTHNEGEEYHHKMTQFIIENNLQEQVFIRPFRKDIAVFYQAIDVFVMASKAETVGMVTLEALASNTPVIGSNSGGTMELLENGKLGYLFEPENFESLVEAITNFYRKEKKWPNDELNKSTQKYDHHTVTEQVENHLSRLKK